MGPDGEWSPDVDPDGPADVFVPHEAVVRLGDRGGHRHLNDRHEWAGVEEVRAREGEVLCADGTVVDLEDADVDPQAYWTVEWLAGRAR